MRYKVETGTNVLSIEFSMYGYPTSRTMCKYTSPYIQGQNRLGVGRDSPDRFTERNSYSREECSPISTEGTVSKYPLEYVGTSLVYLG